MPGIAVINNPRSRQNRRNPDRMRKFGYILGSRGDSKSTWTFDDLGEALREFKAREIDILAINGGDGSSHVILTKMIEVYGDQPLPQIALLRGGTLNTISDALGIKGTTSWLLYNLQEKYANGEPFVTVERDLMKIGENYGFLFGNGIVANFMEEYYTTGEPSPAQGVRTLYRCVGSAIVGGPLIKGIFRQLTARVVVDGEELPGRAWSAVMSGSIHEIGVGFSPFHRCEDRTGAFHILFLDCSGLHVVMELWHIYKGRALHPRLGHEAVASRVRIEADEPWAYTIDGDMHVCESGTMDLSAGPRLTMIVQ